MDITYHSQTKKEKKQLSPKLNIEEYEHHFKPEVNYGAPEGKGVHFTFLGCNYNSFTSYSDFFNINFINKHIS